MKYYIIIIIGLISLIADVCFADLTEALPQVGKGSKYELVCRHGKDGNYATATLMKISSKGNSQKVASIELDGLLLVYSTKFVKLQSQKGASQTAVIVVGDGHTRRWVYVIAINAITGNLKPILNEWHESNIGYHLNKQGILTGLSLKYVAWHASRDEDFPGHVYLIRDFSWSVNKQQFIPGKIQVDEVSENKATLVQLLHTVGSDTLGVEESYRDEISGDHIFVFVSKGLLRSKIPMEMRWAKRIKVRTRIALHEKGDEIQLIEISALK